MDLKELDELFREAHDAEAGDSKAKRLAGIKAVADSISIANISALPGFAEHPQVERIAKVMYEKCAKPFRTKTKHTRGDYQEWGEIADQSYWRTLAQIALKEIYRTDHD